MRCEKKNVDIPWLYAQRQSHSKDAHQAPKILTLQAMLSHWCHLHSTCRTARGLKGQFCFSRLTNSGFILAAILGTLSWK